MRRTNKSVLRLVKGSWKHIGTPRMTRCFTNRPTLSPGNLISVIFLKEKRKDNTSRSFHLHCQIPVRYRTLYTWLENINFHSLSRYDAKPPCADHPCLLGSTNPCPTAVHRKPFSNSGLQLLHVNVCYYHRDLHQELFYSSLRQELRSKPQRPPTNCCIV